MADDAAVQLARLSRTLKEMGDKGLQRELSKGVAAAAKPFRDRVKANALSMLPASGGLNERVARQVVPRVRRAASKRASGVRLVAAGKPGMKGVRRLDEGTVRHPVFGDEETWVTQSVTPGFWSQAVEDTETEARAAVEKALGDVAQKIERSI